MALPMLRSDALLALPGLVHGFTTRWGEDGAPLDLGSQASPDAWDAVSRALGRPGAEVARCHQVHGADVVIASHGGDQGQCDGLVSTTRGLLLAVRVADCVPVLLAAPGGVAAVHAGWRGLAAGIIGVAVQALREQVGDAEIAAAVGPCIGVERYEVGAEVVAGIATRVPTGVFVVPRSPRPHVDLRAAAAWQLRSAGVSDVDVLPHCTYDDLDLHSYRRDQARSGRLAALVGLTR